MMQKFEIISPGKIILHGEHAVVYGKPAIASVIGLSTNLKFKAKPNSSTAIFNLETLHTSLSLNLEDFNNFLQEFSSKDNDNKLDWKANLLEGAIKEVTKELQKIPISTNRSHLQKAYTSIYYLLAGATLSSSNTDLELKSGFELSLDSEINIGSGLGSSASFGSAIAAAFLLFTKHFDLDTYLEPENLSLISEWAFESERVMHGKPSGVDNTVCTFGGMLRFIKGRGFQSLSIQRPLNLLLVDSRVNRSTADVVANVRHLWETFPNLLSAIWKSCEELVAEAVPLYESFGNEQDDSEKFEKLERLFQINNDLMKAVGVTHPKLEEIFAISFKRGFFSKLTGAGAGGFAIILLPEKYESNEVYWKLVEELQAAGFEVHPTNAGGDGLRIKAIN